MYRSLLDNVVGLFERKWSDLLTTLQNISEERLHKTSTRDFFWTYQIPFLKIRLCWNLFLAKGKVYNCFFYKLYLYNLLKVQSSKLKKSTNKWSLTCFESILKILHSNYFQFFSDLPVKFAIFLKCRLLFNSS